MPSPIHQNFLSNQASIEAKIGEPVSISGLTGPLRIFQRLNGHRHSIDDTTTAWYALQKHPKATSLLDLGSGIGTVGMITLWGLPKTAFLTCIEAQDVSYSLLTANIESNDLNSRVETIHGDLRHLNLNKKFELITGSPPYFPKHAGILPSDPQKAYARFELRGDVGDYARAAMRHLEDDGVFVYCFPFQHKERGIKLVQDAGLKIATIKDVIPRPGKDPLFSLYSARIDWKEATEHESPLIVSPKEGELSPEMQALQLSRGFGPDGTNLVN